MICDPHSCGLDFLQNELELELRAQPGLVSDIVQKSSFVCHVSVAGWLADMNGKFHAKSLRARAMTKNCI